VNSEVPEENSRMSITKWILSWHTALDVLALLVILLSVTPPLFGRGDWEVGPAVLITGLVMGVSLMFRRRFADWVLGINIVLTLVLMWLGVSGAATGIPTAIAIYAVALSMPRVMVWRLSAVTALALMSGFVAFADFDLFEPSWIAFAAVPALSAALGTISRSRHDLLAASEERARIAEEGREAEVSRSIAEERLRIARDLHDLIAHQIAAVGLHAELAERSISSNQDQAKASLQIIKDSSRQGLHDIAELMKVLREDGESGQTLSLVNLSDLIARYEQAGLFTDLRIEGELSDLPAVVDAVAYRIIQEGLTNANKHGQGQKASLTISRTDDELVIEVSNQATTTQSQPSSGYGLTGIRERVATVSGEVSAGLVTPSNFQLLVKLPIPGGAR
jgi:signal transduction histidine kinase